MKLTDERTTLFQWDTGRSVTADSAQVHFSNKQLGRSFDVDVKDGVALIPDMLLTCAAPIKAWAWVGTATEGYTKEELIIPVQPRNKPADYVFTPTEQTTLADIQGQIGDLSELKTTARDNLVDAINEAVESGGASMAENVKYTNADLPNVENVKQALDANTASIKSDKSAIAANTAAANKNAQDISAILGNLATDEAQIKENKDNIAQNTKDISDNAQKTATNTTNIAKNTEKIAENTGNISKNTEKITANTAAIADNASKTATNTSDIQANTAAIQLNTAAIAKNTEKAHTHSNKTTLDKFGESNGQPTFDGQTINSQLTGLYFNSQNDSVTYSDGIAVFVGQFQLTTADGNSTFANGSVTLPIVAGAGIKIDASKDGRSLIIKAASTEYVISGNYGHCENNNPAAVADEGTAYVATITANSGYNFGTGYALTVTMGGTDITSEVAVVSTDTISINIPSVTGNIDINCVAVVIPTKLATPTIAINADGKTLEITDVANAQRYKIYANGELKGSVDKNG